MSNDDLTQQITETERLISVFGNATEVIVGTEDQIYSRRGLINRTVITAAEIGDTIVNILARRLAAMRAELRRLGVEDQGESRSPTCRPDASPACGVVSGAFTGTGQETGLTTTAVP